MCSQHWPMAAGNPGASCKGPCTLHSPHSCHLAGLAVTSLPVTHDLPNPAQAELPGGPARKSPSSLSMLTTTQGIHAANFPSLLRFCRTRAPNVAATVAPWPLQQAQHPVSQHLQCCAQFAPEVHRVGPLWPQELQKLGKIPPQTNLERREGAEPMSNRQHQPIKFKSLC